MTKYIPFLIFLSLFGLNAYIYLSTERKIENYAKSPPFRMEDFTKSIRKNKSSKIKHLRDSDKTSFWIKEQSSSHPEHDLELELSLTHFYSESKFKKRDFHTLTFYSCQTKENNSLLKSPSQMQVGVYLREAINIDKELRLPIDTKVASFDLDFNNSDRVIFDISNLFTLQDSNVFPEKIYIVTLFLKDNSKHESGGKTCLSEIEIE